MFAANQVTPELKNAIISLAEIVKPALKEIHAKNATTKNYYGDYLGFLTPMAADKGKVKLTALAMMYAGANPEGVESAVKILTGE